MNIKVSNLGILFVLVMNVLLVVSCKRTPDFPYNGKPKGTISLERAQDMYRAYQARFDALTAFRQGNEDARYGWHSIDFYKDYIAYLENESSKVNMKVSGIRLYYVAYPDDQESGNQRDYQTYIFVPTYYDEAAKKHIAFDPLHMGDDGKPLRIHDVITKGQRPQKRSMVSTSIVAVAQAPASVGNMGEMCKPNCSE